MRAPLTTAPYIISLLERMEAVLQSIGLWRYAIAGVGALLIALNLWARWQERQNRALGETTLRLIRKED